MSHSLMNAPSKPAKSIIRSSLAALISVALGLSAAPVMALDDDPGTALLRTSFASPGARAAGMGGAFIGLADDSSAAFLNPAGIVLLPQKELTFEARYSDQDPSYLSAAPPGAVETDSSSSAQISYLSYAIPMEQWGLGFFYGSLADSEFSAVSDEFTPVGSSGSVVTTAASVSLEDIYYGGSVAFSLTDNAKIGAAVYRVQRDLTSTSLLDGTIAYGSSTDDADIGFNVGAHFKISDAWSLGLSYRSELEFDSELSFLNDDFFDAGSTVIPSALSVGLGWRPSDRLVWALDLSQINHSDRLNSARTPLSGTLSGIDFADLEADDSVDIRLGMEYALEGNKNQWFIRGGLAHLGTSEFKYVAPANVDAQIPEALFPGGDDETHVTFGVGMAAEKFGLDWALDWSDQDIQSVVSVVVYFE